MASRFSPNKQAAAKDTMSEHFTRLNEVLQNLNEKYAHRTAPKPLPITSFQTPVTQHVRSLTGQLPTTEIVKALGPSSQSATGKLLDLKQQLESFGKQIALEKRLKQESIEQQRASVAETTERVERTLNSEIKRRVESNKQLQTMFAAHLHAMEDNVEQHIQKRLGEATAKLASMTKRLKDLENQIGNNKTSLSTTVKEKFAALQKQFNGLQQAVGGAIQHSETFDQGVSLQIHEFESKVDTRLKEEKRLQDGDHRAFIALFASVTEQEMQREAEYERQIMQELAFLRAQLESETRCRESADDDIVVALNTFTAALQDGLRMVAHARATDPV
eukprot:GILK01004829.1.p1 GENE.GILK01004829.1~~GILK01004829.1.p1  ORF type:complete len:332 (-),score=71.84 GILK01004829.1:213-1208(-)